ncbi:MAG TPA: four helix bundle protein [Kiritimatiellia bacterium]|nr:four helix bundle protein [Kiritimatiellia bacterium]HMP00235.1 four helix bundle protein [Kiritimatiellia bacterium]HMP97188.1 four helix bundle protein [Kiritimatiellia bacterium]
MPFNHENLIVYQRTLPFNVKVGVWTGQWDSRHALCDQLSRAAASMLENIALASAAYSTMKLRGLDYAIGSSLECAACLDLAGIKQLLDMKSTHTEKQELSQILRMLVGLRKCWAQSRLSVREDSAEYSTQGEGGDKDHDKVRDNDDGENALFHHETLDVYKVGIEAAMAIYSSDAVSRLPNSIFRRLDQLLTSMVLNIAEGNGRFSGSDQARFLETSHESAIKLAARLDLCVIQNLLPLDDVAGWKALLERVSVMTSSMILGLLR